MSKNEKVEYGDGNLPFAKAEITRLMKENLDDDKMLIKFGQK